VSRDPAAILAAVRPATSAATVCLRGDLVARYQQLAAELADLPAAVETLAGLSGPAADVAADMEALREEIATWRETFTFRALGPAFVDHQVRLPDDALRRDDRAAYEREYDAWVCDLAAACVVDPDGFTVDHFAQLHAALSTGDWLRIRAAVIDVNAGASTVPFSATASVLSRISDGRSRRPAPPAPAVPDSLADPVEPLPSTSTTTPVD
jgi:hypothetical protein